MDLSNLIHFPNLPYISYHDLKLTESKAILYYLADKFDPSLLGSTPEDRARVNQLVWFLEDYFLQIAKLCMNNDFEH